MPSNCGQVCAPRRQSACLLQRIFCVRCPSRASVAVGVQLARYGPASRAGPRMLEATSSVASPGGLDHSASLCGRYRASALFPAFRPRRHRFLASSYRARRTAAQRYTAASAGPPRADASTRGSELCCAVFGTLRSGSTFDVGIHTGRAVPKISALDDARTRGIPLNPLLFLFLFIQSLISSLPPISFRASTIVPLRLSRPRLITVCISKR